MSQQALLAPRVVERVEKAIQVGQHAFSFLLVGTAAGRRPILLPSPALPRRYAQLLTMRSTRVRGTLRAHREPGAARAQARGERARQPHAASFLSLSSSASLRLGQKKSVVSFSFFSFFSFSSSLIARPSFGGCFVSDRCC